MYSDQEHAVSQYTAWQKLREKAIQNAPGGKMPEGYIEPYRAPPPPPIAVDDADMMDLSIELNAASIEDVSGDLDESGLERVPMADPGLDVRRWVIFTLVAMNMTFFYRCSDLYLRLEIMSIQVTNQCIRAERVYSQVFDLVLLCDISIKQWLSVDPTVLRDLQAHRSLELQ